MDAAQPPAPQQYTDDEISLADIILFISRYWLLVLGPGMCAAVLCVVYFGALPVEYESTATLIVAPGRTSVSGEATRPTLNVQAYQKLIESEAIKRETARRLIKEGVLTETKQPSISGKTRIVPATRADESAVLEATGSGRSENEAMKVTNMWVKTFLDHVQKTVTDTNTVAGNVLQGQLDAAKKELLKQEDERIQLIEKLNSEFQAAQQKMELAIVEVRTKAAETVAAYNAETAVKSETLSAELNLDGRGAELQALRGVLLKLQQEQAELGPQLSARRQQLEAVRRKLEHSQPALLLRRTLTDDALLSSNVGKRPESIDWAALQRNVLVTETLNPVYTELTRQLAENEVFVQAGEARLKLLQEEIAGLQARSQKLSTELARDQARKQALEIERNTGLFKIKSTTQLEIANSERRRDEGLKALEAAQDDLKLRAERVLQPQRDLTQQLARDWNRILQAKATEELTDLRIGADAVEPGGPVGRKTLLYSAAAAIAGCMLGVFAALVIHVRRTQKTTPGA